MPFKGTIFRLLPIVFLAFYVRSPGWAQTNAEAQTNASAQTNATRQTNGPATTNAAPAPARPAPFVRGFEHLDEKYVTFGLDRIPGMRTTLLFGEPLWKYFASLFYIVLAFFLSRLIHFMTHAWLSRLAAKTSTKVDDLLLQMLRGPLQIVVFLIVLGIGLNIFDWSYKARNYLSKTFILMVAAVLTYLAIKVNQLFLDLWKRRSAHESDRRFNEQLFSILRRSLNTFIIVVAILVTASNIGINITAVITSLSIGGLAVGLAAQDTLANLFGAVAIFADKPFRVGDHIKLDAAEGTVEYVGMRSTRVRNADGFVISVPNKIMGNAPITNISRRSNLKTTMNFALARNLPAEKVKRALEILSEVYRSHPMTQDAWISFNQFAGANINIMVVHWSKEVDQQKYLAGMQEMNLTVKERFDAEGINFA